MGKEIDPKTYTPDAADKDEFKMALVHLADEEGWDETDIPKSIATVKASELVALAHVVFNALGVPSTRPTLILTDNLSNQKVCQNAQSSARSRYYLVRAVCLHQRVASGEMRVVHVSDPAMPADFLTKAINQEKTAASIAYASGSAAN